MCPAHSSLETVQRPHNQLWALDLVGAVRKDRVGRKKERAGESGSVGARLCERMSSHAKQLTDIGHRRGRGPELSLCQPERKTNAQCVTLGIMIFQSSENNF